MRWTDELHAALDREFDGNSRVMMLATVDAAGGPHVRCLVCRRIDDEGRIYAAIDSRTQKDPQLRSERRAEILFWMPKIRVQFRITGEARIVTFPEDEVLHKEVWQRLSDQSRSLFFWPIPGIAADSDNAFPQAVSADVSPPRNFEVFILSPKQVDRLSLDSHPHRRRVWRSDTNWSGVDINP
jgi:PPOX class probable FMN-dependent enzyme